MPMDCMMSVFKLLTNQTCQWIVFCQYSCQWIVFCQYSDCKIKHANGLYDVSIQTVDKSNMPMDSILSIFTLLTNQTCQWIVFCQYLDCLQIKHANGFYFVSIQTVDKSNMPMDSNLSTNHILMPLE
ncbi:hypothetical protein CHS0354_034871 [Potamilus streckersoni]|uniref:Uncharacterized protein n=1 Tax=Potamilus streckersoni TaxID=2493646 RepID=A0AAE0S823_9BIVA|nr:hypothetical protein CHS0354_034871 [Potamilus streckersoni]